MTARKPLAISSGQIQQLQTGDALNGVEMLLNSATFDNTVFVWDDTTSITSAYRNYTLVFRNVRPEVTGNAIAVQVYSGGALKSADYYIHNSARAGASSGNGGGGPTSNMTFPNSPSIMGTTGRLTLINPAQTTGYKLMWFHGGFGDRTSGLGGNMFVSGAWKGGTGAVDGLRVSFLLATKLAAGSVYLYGWN